MKKPKATYLFIVLDMIAMCASTVNAGPITGSNENYDYLLGGTDFSKFCMGVYMRERTYRVGWDPSLTQYAMDMKKTSGYIGYDVFRWATLYLIAGNTDTRLSANHRIYGNSQQYNGAEKETGYGLQINLIDHDIADPSLEEDRIRVNIGAEYTRSKTDHPYSGSSVRWEEVYTSLTVSLINQIHGTKLYWPNAIAIYGGPIWGHIVSTSIDHSGEAGVTFGATIMYSENVTFDLGFESLEKEHFIAGVNVRF
jgi:hypothetical protein